MVHLSVVRLVRSRGPDKWWKRKFVFDQTYNFYGRRANCYSVAVKAMQKAWKRMHKSRRVHTRDMQRLHVMRVNAAAVEHGMRYSEFIGSLPKHNVLLDRKILSQLAVTEPKTFKCLVDLARIKQEEFIIEQCKERPELLEKKLTQDDLLAQAMDKLSVNKSSNKTETVHSATGRETAV